VPLNWDEKGKAVMEEHRNDQRVESPTPAHAPPPAPPAATTPHAHSPAPSVGVSRGARIRWDANQVADPAKEKQEQAAYAQQRALFDECSDNKENNPPPVDEDEDNKFHPGAANSSVSEGTAVVWNLHNQFTPLPRFDGAGGDGAAVVVRPSRLLRLLSLWLLRLLMHMLTRPVLLPPQPLHLLLKLLLPIHLLLQPQLLMIRCWCKWQWGREEC